MKHNASPPLVISAPVSGAQVNFPTFVTLSPDVPEATVRFTIDGTEPDSLSEIYRGPIPIESSGVVLRAIAHREDGKEGPIATVQYSKNRTDYENPSAV